MKQKPIPPGMWPGLQAFTVILLLGLQSSFASEGPRLPPLTTVSGSARLPGKFVWADLVTHDVPTARKFYSQLFGWTFRDYGGYLIAASDERPLAGLVQRPRPAGASARPRWIGYISVASVSRAERAAIKGGGKVVVPARQYPQRGEQAVFADPEGGLFGVIRSQEGDPEDFLAEPGEWIWIQLLSRDGRKAAEFYRKVVGYEIVENTEPDRLSDWVLTSDGYARATVRTIPSHLTQVQPNWLPFVRVANLKEALGRAEQLGGKVLVQPRPEALAGKVAVIADPTGAAVGLLEWDESLMKGAQ